MGTPYVPEARLRHSVALHAHVNTGGHQACQGRAPPPPRQRQQQQRRGRVQREDHQAGGPVRLPRRSGWCSSRGGRRGGRLGRVRRVGACCTDLHVHVHVHVHVQLGLSGVCVVCVRRARPYRTCPRLKRTHAAHCSLLTTHYSLLTAWTAPTAARASSGGRCSSGAAYLGRLRTMVKGRGRGRRWRWR